jgi:PHP family Zn ribbon phosphoesterase
VATRFGIADKSEIQLQDLSILPKIRRGDMYVGGIKLIGVEDEHEFHVFEEAWAKASRRAEFKTLRSIVFSQEPNREMRGLVGLVEVTSAEPLEQTLTIYADNIRELSEEAAIGVVGHELGHVWLNEHVGTEDSDAREREADEKAIELGFRTELQALKREAYSVSRAS